MPRLRDTLAVMAAGTGNGSGVRSDVLFALQVKGHTGHAMAVLLAAIVFRHSRRDSRHSRFCR